MACLCQQSGGGGGSLYSSTLERADQFSPSFTARPFPPQTAPLHQKPTPGPQLWHGRLAAGRGTSTRAGAAPRPAARRLSGAAAAAPRGPSACPAAFPARAHDPPPGLWGRTPRPEGPRRRSRPAPFPPPQSLTGTYRRGAGGRPPPPPLLPPSNGCSGGAAPSPPRPAWPRPQRRRRHFNLPRRPLCSRRSPMMRPLPAPSRSRPPASPPLITLRSDARTRAAPPPAPALGLAYRPHLLRARTIWRTGAEKRRPGRMPQVLEEGAAFRAGLFRWASSLGGLKETDGCRGERESPHVRPSRPVFPPQGARSSTAGERLPPLPGRSRCWVLPHARAL